MPKLCLLLVSAVLLCVLSGCAVYMAANQPQKRNLAVLKPGTERDLVIAELGAPVISEPNGEEKKEIYTFVQGYSKLTKAGRALFHGAADVFTIGLWEAVGTPVEGAFDGKKISVRVIFDAAGRVKESTTLSIEDPKNEANKAPEPTSTAVTSRAMALRFSHSHPAAARVAPAVLVAHL